MKKAISLLLILSLALPFWGCDKNGPSTKEGLRELLDVLGLEGHTLLYTSQGGAEESEVLARIYGRSDAINAFSSVSEYAIALPKKEGGAEIHVLKMRHSSDEEGLKALLRGRMDVLQAADVKGYLGDAYADCLGMARIYQKGRYLFLLATADNDRAMEAIGKIF